jgi:DNA-binding NarL/FixJ family response regulator
MIRLLVVDDHPVVREGLVAVLRDEPDFQVVGAVGSAEEAVELAGSLQPDVVLLDLELPGMDGVAATPVLLQAVPNTCVLVFTAYDTDERVAGAIQAGARGYLLKGAPAEEIGRAVRTVRGGGTYLGPGIAAKLLSRAHSLRSSGPQLTERERQVLRLMVEGRPNKQIGQALGIAERTVKFHVSSLFRKLGAESRSHAVALAIHQGLL